MRHAFSLVELSIVLVILGLLTGGILAGKSLIHAAELRKILSESERFTTAIHTFKDKYFGLPGDINNADKFWPTVTNGNADGKLYAVDEHVDAWQQLSLAGLIEGSYDGIWDVSGYSPPGSNSPKSSYGTAIWAIQGDIIDTGSWSVYKRIDNHLILTGDTVSAGNSIRVLTASDAWTLDTKKDDGKAQYGKFLASGTAVCVNNSISNAPNPAVDYDLTAVATDCVIYFFL